MTSSLRHSICINKLCSLSWIKFGLFFTILVYMYKTLFRISLWHMTYINCSFTFKMEKKSRVKYRFKNNSLADTCLKLDTVATFSTHKPCPWTPSKPFDPTSVDVVACVTLPKDHCAQVSLHCRARSQILVLGLTGLACSGQAA